MSLQNYYKATHKVKPFRWKNLILSTVDKLHPYKCCRCFYCCHTTVKYRKNHWFINCLVSLPCSMHYMEYSLASCFTRTPRSQQQFSSEFTNSPWQLTASTVLYNARHGLLQHSRYDGSQQWWQESSIRRWTLWVNGPCWPKQWM